ncbi:MAG TPA: hypothetical protein VGM83_02250 [Devosiaceae bacterium]
MTSKPLNVHGTGLVLGQIGVLLRGPSGSGKSLLALELLDRWTQNGDGAVLVADDRLDLSLVDGAIVMAAPANIAGLIELRGRGIVRRPYRQQALVQLVVDLVDSLERMPETAAFQIDLMGHKVARAPVPRRGVVDSQHQIMLVREALADYAHHGLQQCQKTT